MKYSFFLLFWTVFPVLQLHAQQTIEEVLWLQSLVDVEWGEGSFTSQQAEYFPANLNAPTTSATRFAPSTEPTNIVSLGLGGSIVLSCGDEVCIDREGTDFIVFENAFEIQGLGRLFIEPAVVSVSRDGNEWASFAVDSSTMQGAAGIDFTRGDMIETNVLEAGGTHFDLATVGMDSIRFIRIEDVSALIKDPSHPLFDPIVDGFDLDAIGVVNHVLSPPTSIQDVQENLVEMISGGILANVSAESVDVKLFDVRGRLVFNQRLLSNSEMNLQNLVHSTFVFIQCFNAQGGLVYSSNTIVR